MSALDSSSTDNSVRETFCLNDEFFQLDIFLLYFYKIKLQPTQNDDSLFDVDLIEVDDLLNSASRLLEEVYSIRPAIESSITSPREDAMEQGKQFSCILKLISLFRHKSSA